MKKIIFIVLGLIITVNGYSQNNEEEQKSEEFEQLIIGTWVPEDVSYDYRSVYNADCTLVEHYANDPNETYTWSISTTTTESGLLSSDLVIVNTQDPDDKYKYLIDTLTEERMVLVYDTGIGISKNTYIRQ